MNLKDNSLDFNECIYHIFYSPFSIIYKYIEKNVNNVK